MRAVCDAYLTPTPPRRAADAGENAKGEERGLMFSASAFCSLTRGGAGIAVKSGRTCRCLTNRRELSGSPSTRAVMGNRQRRRGETQRPASGTRLNEILTDGRAGGRARDNAASRAGTSLFRFPAIPSHLPPGREAPARSVPQPGKVTSIQLEHHQKTRRRKRAVNPSGPPTRRGHAPRSLPTVADRTREETSARAELVSTATAWVLRRHPPPGPTATQRWHRSPHYTCTGTGGEEQPIRNDREV
ncbi:hypothetical protein SKAU_G00084620 [Synaphobranchus kaupii]|uniref:Uncharacterized protein n=1 Tax=Synaphobranchus kaupii TaxID=118154 RepID=A0A9Q1J5I9_SYNKA|nr:hypothetical protein SKAU_G00084620 [Synaphobranchus kaupii]